MATHRDVVQRAAFVLGMRRGNQDLGGEVYDELLGSLEDLLLEIDDDIGLDFDPTDASGVPDERVGPLVNVFMYQPIFDIFDRRRTASERVLLEKDSRKRLNSAVLGESDSLDIGVYDF